MKLDNVRIMVVGADVDLVRRIRGLLPQDGVHVSQEPDIDRVLERFESESYDVLLITHAAFKAGESSGIELVEVITAKSPMTQVLFLARPGSIRTAMAALKAGTYQYAKLPVSDEELRMLIETAVEKRPQYGVNLLLEGPEKQKSRFGDLIGRSEPMQHLYRQIRQAAATDIPILLIGETGTGKDLVAQAIHRRSACCEGPYVPINLGALPTELVASELFGHEKGAFTGAAEQHKGIFERAHNGTVFLDEIGAIDEKVQVSLLRLIERKKFRRLGGRRALSSSARLIAASNKNLADAVEEGAFREDLYYRLDVFRMTLAPLRDRPGDIPLLIDEFLKRFNEKFQRNVLGIAPECVSLLESYEWPGNVRELKNAIQRTVLVCTGDVILPEHLPPRFRPVRRVYPKITFEVGTPLEDVEREMVARALAVAKGNRTQAAELLGISRRALYNKLRRHGLQ